MWMLDPAAAPRARFTDEVRLVIPLIMGVTMVYYGWPRLRDPKKNAGLARLAFGSGRSAIF